MWKQIPGFEGYEVCEDGRVRNTKTKHILTPIWTGNKRIRQYATLVLHGKQVKVHRAVLLAFRGPPPKGKPYGLHRNDDVSNNRLSNLYWGSPKENVHAITERKGQIMDSKARADARKAHAAGEKISALASRYGVSHLRMWEICYRHWELKQC